MRCCGYGKLAGIALASTLALGLMMGQGCPSAGLLGNLPSIAQQLGNPGTQPSGNGAGSDVQIGSGALLLQTFTSAPFTATFTLSETSQPVDVLVSGDNSASRVTFSVTDPSGTAVATVDNPSSNVSSATFTPTTAGNYSLSATETGTAATLYILRVVQVPSVTPGQGNGGENNFPPFVLLHQLFTSAPITATFTPPQTGQIVDVAVAGDNNASRPTLTITDPTGATVASATNPTSNVSSATFTPELAGAYTLTVNETGAASGRYDVLVTQPLLHGLAPGRQGGPILEQTFTSAPITATFAPAQTGQVIDVLVSGTNAASRVTFTVTDPSGTPVASVNNPSTNVSSTTFTPSAAGTYTLTAAETGTTSALYVVRVVQPLNDGFEPGGGHAILQQRFKAVPITATFTPPATGRIVNVLVAGNKSGSRLAFTVTDPNGATVAIETSPTDNISTATFTPEVAGTYTLTATETGTTSRVYIVQVIQPRQASADDESAEGELLHETFASAPITATFAPTQAGQLVRIVVASDNTDSRITFTVTDSTAAVVASVTNPSTNVSSTTFTPAALGTYTLTATETGTAGALYAVRVDQPPDVAQE